VLCRLYTPQDFAALYAIEERCFEPLFRFGRRTMRQFVSRSNAATWLAEEDGELKGFAMVEWTEHKLRLCGGGPSPQGYKSGVPGSEPLPQGFKGGVPGDGSSLPGCKSRVTAYIQTIEVAPEARGRGVGRALLGPIENSALAAGAVRIRLHVDAENAGAIRLYEAQGYRCQGRQENYYPLSRAALIYLKRLDCGRES
jgi:ribosomal protein S18 acetylase RimI-like enzyme